MNKTLSLLGMCRKAHMLCIGHDAVMDSVRAGRARLIIISSDASERHLRELEAVHFAGDILRLEADMNSLGEATGKRSCIFSVDDEGFAKLIKKTNYEEGSI